MQGKKFLLFTSGLILLCLLLTSQSVWLPSGKRLDMGDTAGVHESGNPQICTSGSYVYAVWDDDRDGKSDIYFNVSSDNGATWSSTDIRLDTGDTAGANFSTKPQICSSGSYIYAVWQDYRNGMQDIYFNRSEYPGTAWMSSDARLDTGDSAGANRSRNPQICCVGKYVYVIWEDKRNGQEDIYFNVSSDFGASWLRSDKRIDTGDTAGAYVSEDPQFCCSGSYVYAVWMDRRNGNYDIYFNRSMDYGVTWRSSDVRLCTGDAAGTNVSYLPQVCSTGHFIYAVWEDARNGEADIYFNRSADNGETWMSSAVRIDTGDAPGAYDSWEPQICGTEGYVYAVWEDKRNGEWDIYFNMSTDNGDTWLSSSLRLDTGDAAGANESYQPQIFMAGDSVYVVWTDIRNVGEDIYFNVSTDNGEAWLSSDIRIDTGDPAGASHSFDPQLCCRDGLVHAVWSDERNGERDIYTNRSNRAPAADAGSDKSTTVGTSVRLDGSYSSDPDRDHLTYHWSFDSVPSGSAAVLNNADKSFCSFTPDKKGEYELRLEVEDPFGEGSADTAKVTVKAIYDLTMAAGEGGTTSPAPGIYSYTEGTVVTIEGLPDTHYEFSGWTGDFTGTLNPADVTMNSDKYITANFVRVIYPPLNFTGERVENRSLSQVEYINELTWEAEARNVDIVTYRLYRKNSGGWHFLSELTSSTFRYLDRNVEAEVSYEYKITAVDSESREGQAAFVLVE